MGCERTGEETGGSIGFLEGTPAPDHPTPYSPLLRRAVYVLEGQFLFLVGERQERGQPGTFVFFPRGTSDASKIMIEPGKVLAA